MSTVSLSSCWGLCMARWAFPAHLCTQPHVAAYVSPLREAFPDHLVNLCHFAVLNFHWSTCHYLAFFGSQPSFPLKSENSVRSMISPGPRTVLAKSRPLSPGGWHALPLFCPSQQWPHRVVCLPREASSVSVPISAQSPAQCQQRCGYFL